MKKFLVLLFLMAIGFSVSGQKCYVNVVGSPYLGNGDIYLTGAVPSDMTSYYNKEMGVVLNMLAERGFVVEYMCCTSAGTSSGTALTPLKEVVILSKTSTPPTNTIDGGAVTEVARYNLQNLPVNKDEKGVQIIVYSNYTTKTITVE